MDFRISRHAVEQMLSRDITLEMIDAVLSAPQWNPPSTRNTRYDGLVAGRRLSVVVTEDTDPPLVVTVFWYEER